MYFSQSFETRKLLVDLCAELYQMNHEEQSMFLNMARAYRKGKPAVVLAPKQRDHLRLVA